MTASNHTNIITSVSMLLLLKSTRQVRDKYNINSHCITVLFGCYLLNQYVKQLYTKTDVQVIVTYYNINRIKFYLDILVSKGLVFVDDNSTRHRYSITQQGIDSINEITNRMTDLVYDFCNKYNIEL